MEEGEVTAAELDRVARLAEGARDGLKSEFWPSREALQALGLTLLPRLARTHRRVRDERDTGLLTDDLVAPAVVKAERAAYDKGRREAIEEAARRLRVLRDERAGSGRTEAVSEMYGIAATEIERHEADLRRSKP